MFDTPTTRQKDTLDLYLKKTKNFIKEARKHLGLLEHQGLDNRQFVAWLLEKKTTLNKRSWRLYKSAVMYYLETQDSNDAMEALEFLREIGTDGCKDQSTQTSSQKMKKFPWKDFQKITEYLLNNPGKWHQCLYDWIVAASLTGLRPQEWTGAKLLFENEQYTLQIKNAKHTNGRAHGPTRTLILTQLSTDEIEILDRHVNRVMTWNNLNQFKDFYEGCALSLYYLNRKLFPNRKKHITLYSCRHQFTANAKASGFSPAEIAAMMGHAVDTTASRHYGKKVAGHELLRVRATETDISNVKQKFLTKEQSLKLRAKNMPEPQPNGS